MNIFPQFNIFTILLNTYLSTVPLMITSSIIFVLLCIIIPLAVMAFGFVTDTEQPQKLTYLAYLPMAKLVHNWNTFEKENADSDEITPCFFLSLAVIWLWPLLFIYIIGKYTLIGIRFCIRTRKYLDKHIHDKNTGCTEYKSLD